MNITLTKTSIGIITKSDTYCEDWMRLLFGKTVTKDINKFVTRAVKELVDSCELDKWDPKEKSRVLGDICQAYTGEKCSGKQITAYETEDGEDAIDIRLWNDYPADLVNCELDSATHVVLLGDVSEFATSEKPAIGNTPKVYLINRKEVSLRDFLLGVLKVQEDALSAVDECIDLEDEIIVGGPFVAEGGKTYPVITVFPVKDTFGQ